MVFRGWRPTKRFLRCPSSYLIHQRLLVPIWQVDGNSKLWNLHLFFVAEDNALVNLGLRNLDYRIGPQHSDKLPLKLVAQLFSCEFITSGLAIYFPSFFCSCLVWPSSFAAEGMAESSSSNPSDDAVSGLLEHDGTSPCAQKLAGLDFSQDISSCFTISKLTPTCSPLSELHVGLLSICSTTRNPAMSHPAEPGNGHQHLPRSIGQGRWQGWKLFVLLARGSDWENCWKGVWVDIK